MRKLGDQLDSTVFDVRQEVVAGGFEKSTEGICGDLFLDADYTVDFKHLVDINFFKAVDSDCCNRGTSGGESFRGTAFCT
jgi:hypothetical protein